VALSAFQDAFVKEPQRALICDRLRRAPVVIWAPWPLCYSAAEVLSAVSGAFATPRFRPCLGNSRCFSPEACASRGFV
jgi:hypothetical protein